MGKCDVKKGDLLVEFDSSNVDEMCDSQIVSADVVIGVDVTGNRNRLLTQRKV